MVVVVMTEMLMLIGEVYTPQMSPGLHTSPQSFSLDCTAFFPTLERKAKCC